jgi:hypothetical protein
MCVSVKAPSPPPAPEPIPETPPVVADATTTQKAPATAKSGSANRNMASTVARKRLGRGSLRIPLASSGLSSSGLNFPTS